MKLPIYSGSYVPQLEQLSSGNLAKVESMNIVLADANIAYDAHIRQYPKLKAAFRERRSELTFADIKLTTRTLVELEDRKNYLFWLDETASYLNKEDSWDFMQKRASRKGRRRFEQIRHQWGLGFKTAHLSADALMSISTDVIPNYQTHIHLVEAEFKLKRKSLTDGVVSASMLIKTDRLTEKTRFKKMRTRRKAK